ncbi:MAG: serine hydrolase [Verrucomicrobiota bacterium]|jgi:CubicO group peptidase (beta-lactamase class C family)
MIAFLAKRISAKRIATALLLSVATMSNAFGEESKPGPKSIAELQRAIEAVLKETKTPGAAIAIVSRDKAEWVAGIGKADVAANKPATAETLFRIGSTSKAFAALAALQLQEEGKLKLTDTVRQWVSEVAFTNPWEASDPVRLVHLMEHTTGFDDIHLREYALNDPTPITLKDALVYGASSRVSRWAPGTRMAYCNSGPAVLAAVIEKVSGKRFEDYVQEHFFNPLRMDSASYFYTPAVEQQLAKLYHPDGVTPYPYWHISYRAAGSINASAKDMANYVRFYLQRGSLDGIQLVQSSSIERMERTETLPSAKLGKVAWYGLYNDASAEGAFVFHGHSGAVMGGLTDMAYLPEYGRGYAVMINSGKGKAMNQIAKLVRQYVIRDLTPPAMPPAASVPAELQRHYGGYYQVISPRNQWLYGFERLIYIERLAFSADGLSTSIYGLSHERWVPVSERLFRVEDQSAPTLALLPDADGEVMIQSRWTTFKHVSALRYWAQIVGIALVSVLTLSSVLFAPIWGLRKLLGRLPDAGPLAVRIVPLLSAVLLMVFDGLIVVAVWGMIIGVVTDLSALGTPSFLSVSIMLVSIAYPLAAAASLFIVIRERRAPMNRIAYWHSVFVAMAMAAVAVYYGYWGLIGLRLWA